MTSCLCKLVHFCLAAISLTAFSHRIFKHRTTVTKYFTWKYQTKLHFFCRCSYLFTFILSSQFYWHIRLKSTAYSSDPPCMSVCLCVLITAVSCAKMAEPTEMPFGLSTRRGICPRKHNFKWVLDPHRKGHFWKVTLGHAHTCLRSIFSNVFTRGQQQRGLWQPVYCSNLLWPFSDLSTRAMRMATLPAVSPL